jgi:vacuolar-type H+-ATPase subunit C/Vma6
MLTETEFEFILEDLRDLRSLSGGSIAHIQNKLDRHYYTCLWNSLFKLALSDRSSIERILAEELSLRNAAWALRMRSYYGMSAEQTREYLVCITVRKSRPSLADDALASLTMALDSPADWAKWRWVKFLNRPGEHWTADPRHFQNAAAQYLYRLARHSFRLRPFSLDTAACFIKLKLFEEDLLTSVAEGLSLGMGAQETLTVLEAAV